MKEFIPHLTLADNTKIAPQDTGSITAFTPSPLLTHFLAIERGFTHSGSSYTTKPQSSLKSPLCVPDDTSIDVTSLLLSLDTSKPANILPALNDNDIEDIAAEHDAQPIKNVSDLKRIRDYLILSKRYRDNMLFTIGINTGLRCSDLRLLTFKHFIGDDSIWKSELVILEKKTKNSRKNKVNRHVGINDAMRKSIILYLSANPQVKMDDYLFMSNSNNSKQSKSPLTRQGIQAILVGITKSLDIKIRAGTHCLRKTFSYHMLIQSSDRSRALERLQKMLGHSSSSITLRYAGITADEMRDSYMSFNLGYQDIIDKASCEN